MALNGLYCADVLLSNYSVLTHFHHLQRLQSPFCGILAGYEYFLVYIVHIFCCKYLPILSTISLKGEKERCQMMHISHATVPHIWEL